MLTDRCPQGRRDTPKLHAVANNNAVSVHPDCKVAMKAREIKWERLEAEATEAAASATDQ